MVENNDVSNIATCVLTWRQPLDGATDRGVVRLGSHHLCGSESVAYSSASLRACWWRAHWTSGVTATVTVTDNSTVFIVLESCVFSVKQLQESPAVADKPRDAKACHKLLQFDVLTTLSLTILVYLHLFSCCWVRNMRNPVKLSENSSL